MCLGFVDAENPTQALASLAPSESAKGITPAVTAGSRETHLVICWIVTRVSALWHFALLMRVLTVPSVPLASTFKVVLMLGPVILDLRPSNS